MTKAIDFYFDFISPYAYLANYRLPSIAEKYGYSINYIAIDLSAAKLAAGNTGPASAQIPPKFRYALADLMRWAKKYGVPFAAPFPKESGAATGEAPKKAELPKELFDTSRVNKALYFAQEKGQVREYVDSLFGNSFGAGYLAGDDRVLRTTAEELGWDPEVVFDFVHSTKANEIYAEENKAAQERGVFGVPTMIIGKEMWWGNDRLDLMEEYLEQQSAV